MQYIKFIFMLASVLSFQSPVYAKQSSEAQVGQTHQKILDQTTIKTLEGETIHVDRTKHGLVFRGYDDKIILLEAFGLGCGPCRAAIPAYNRLQKKYKKDMVVIAIEAWGSDSTKLKKYAEAFGIHYKTVSTVDSGKILLFMAKLTGWSTGMGVPYLMLFMRGGILAKDVPPQVFPEDHVNGLIQELLQK